MTTIWREITSKYKDFYCRYRDKNKFTYDVILPTNQGIFNVEVKPTMTTSKIEYSRIPSLNLDYGETKSINIKVTAENGNECKITGVWGSVGFVVASV